MCYNLSMTIFTPLGIVILSMLILAFLQLEPGIFALFSHYATGKFSHKKRAMLTTFFMLGIETVSACLFLCALLFVNLFFMYAFRPETSFLSWIIVGVLFALAVISLFCYYRPGRTGSELFIPRKCAETLESYAAKIGTRSDAFTLGALSSVLELPFSLPIFLISAIAIIELSAALPSLIFLALIFILVPILPLALIRVRFCAGYNLADVIRSRARNKSAIRLVLAFSYLTLAILFMMEFVNGTI